MLPVCDDSINRIVAGLLKGDYCVHMGSLSQDAPICWMYFAVCRSCEALRLCQVQEILHTIQSPGLLHHPLRSPQRSAGKGIATLGPVDKFQALTWAAKQHGMLPNDLTGPDHLDTDLRLRPPTNHSSSSVNSDVIQAVAPCLGYNRSHT